MRKQIGSLIIAGAGIALGAVGTQLATAHADTTQCPPNNGAAVVSTPGQQRAAGNATASTSGSPVAGAPTSSAHASATSSDSRSSVAANGQTSGVAAQTYGSASAPAPNSTDGSANRSGDALVIDGHSGAQGVAPAGAASGNGGVHVVVPRPQMPQLNVAGQLIAG